MATITVVPAADPTPVEELTGPEVWYVSPNLFDRVPFRIAGQIKELPAEGSARSLQISDELLKVKLIPDGGKVVIQSALFKIQMVTWSDFTRCDVYQVQNPEVLPSW
jgi:hypothetical protein